jgi:hypothetical protein
LKSESDAVPEARSQDTRRDREQIDGKTCRGWPVIDAPMARLSLGRIRGGFFLYPTNRAVKSSASPARRHSAPQRELFAVARSVVWCVSAFSKTRPPNVSALKNDRTVRPTD